MHAWHKFDQERCLMDGGRNAPQKQIDDQMTTSIEQAEPLKIPALTGTIEERTAGWRGLAVEVEIMMSKLCMAKKTLVVDTAYHPRGNNYRCKY